MRAIGWGTWFTGKLSLSEVSQGFIHDLYDWERECLETGKEDGGERVGVGEEGGRGI